MDDARRRIRLVMASNSPRRRELMRLIAPDFAVAETRDVDENYPIDLAADEVPSYLSRLKSEAYRDLLVDDEVIITADTVVINHGKILGKPHSEEEAIDMLVSLSGHTHKVVTGVTLMSKTQTETFSETTEVTFSDLTEKEIRYYVDTFRPYDKAGAYGIQEWIGCVGIRGINGCFYNVMGLPLHALYKHLIQFGL